MKNKSKTEGSKMQAKATERAIQSYPEFDTERKARSFARGYIDRVWILRGPGRFRNHFLVAGGNRAARLRKNGFKAIEV
jgi:hypothetical protein